MGSVSPLRGRFVLIVEDEPFTAFELQDTLRTAGANILAASSTEEALALIACIQICAAVVDVNLGGGDCSSICATLAERSIPFVFHTSDLSAAPLSAWPHAPALSKPAEDKTMIDAIVRLLS